MKYPRTRAPIVASSVVAAMMLLQIVSVEFGVVVGSMAILLGRSPRARRERNHG